MEGEWERPTENEMCRLRQISAGRRGQFSTLFTWTGGLQHALVLHAGLQDIFLLEDTRKDEDYEQALHSWLNIYRETSVQACEKYMDMYFSSFLFAI